MEHKYIILAMDDYYSARCRFDRPNRFGKQRNPTPATRKRIETLCENKGELYFVNFKENFFQIGFRFK